MARAKSKKKGADKSISTFDPKTLDYRPKGGDDAIKNATKAIAKEEDYIRRNIAGTNTKQAKGRRKRLA